MTAKTPEQVAEEMFASDFTLGLEDKQVIVAAVTTDRNERDLYELIAQALDERAALHYPEPRSATCRNAAAEVRSGEHDHIWTSYIGSMLDELEKEFGS